MTRKLIFGLFFLLFVYQGAAQTAQQWPLKNVLKNLETRYHLTFSYFDESIRGIELIPPPEDLTVEEVILYLSKHTNLKYQLLEDNYIAISLPEKEIINICGLIKDVETGSPLEGATIHTGRSFTISNDKGQFNLEVSSEVKHVNIQLLGYENQTVALRGRETPCLEIQLVPKITRLKEVFVTNYLTRGINKDFEGSLQIFPEEIGLLPGLTEPDVLYTIQALPGIQSISETVSDINVRGGTNDQNLVLWDGSRMYQSGHFFGLISAFNPYFTDDVTLIKNGTTAAIGEGVSSTIDIRSKDHLVENFSGSAGLNMVYSDIVLNIPLSNKSSLLLSGRRSLADFMETPTFKKYYRRAFRGTDVFNSSPGDTLIDQDQNFYFYDYSVKFLTEFSSRDKISISFLNVYNKIAYEESGVVEDVFTTRTSSLEQQNIASGIKYSHLWSNKVRSVFQFNLSAYELGAVNHDIRNNQRLIQDNEILDLDLKVFSRFQLSNRADLLAGYQLNEVGITNAEDINNPDFRRLIKEVLRTHTLFLEGNLSTPSERTNIRAGIRTNYFEKFDLNLFEPRLALNHRLFNNLYLEVLGEFKHQTSTQVIDFQTDFLGIEKRRWVLANNEDIPIAKSKQLSLGLSYKPAGGEILIDLEGYLKEVDGITSLSQGFLNQFQFQSTSGSYEAKGFDFLFSRRINQINSWLSYSYADNTFQFNDFEPSVFPNNLDITHTFTFGSSLHIGDLEISGGLNWHTGKPFTAPIEGDNIDDENNIIYQSPNSSRLKDYWRIDISAKYEVPTGKRSKLQMGGAIWNVLGERNVLNQYYEVNTENEVSRLRQYALGFTPNFYLRWLFGQ